MKQTYSLLIALGIIFSLSSCNFSKAGQRDRAAAEEQERIALSCAQPRLETSFDFHSRSKNFLSSYYKTRKESELFFAWYAMEDSVFMAKSVRACYDKRNKHFHAARNIFSKNRVLQDLIVQNMRSSVQARLSELYLDQYRKIFVRDIQ